MMRPLAVSLGCLAALTLAACAASPRAPAPTPAPLKTETQVTGSVFYRERIALSPEAVVHVAVVEEGSAAVLGEQTLRAPGQVPIRFSVPLPAERIRPEVRYTLQARITDGARLFTTPEPVLVLTQGHPSQDVQVLVRPGG